VVKVIWGFVVPILPFYIFGMFLGLGMNGNLGSVLSAFAKVLILAVVMTLVYLVLQYIIAGAITGKNPFKALRNMVPAYFTALGTSSSAATIPVSLESTLKNGISKPVASFVIPLCATIHLSGSMITITSCSVAVLFMTGQHPDFGSLIPMILVLGVMMVAAPGVPGGGVMTAIGLLQSMLGFDASMIALMIALYLAQDSFGTATNVTGDATIAALTERISKAIGANPDKEIRDEDIEKAEAISA
ncbi:MAG: cation:dicarboxylase symporter family transporter, partial [Rothia mucilaginosa]